MKELLIEAKVENLDVVIDFIFDALGTASFSQKTQAQISIATEEIFVNIASYAYGDKVGDAAIRVDAAETVVIEFEDSGVPFNPLESENPDITLTAAEREVGGLGIFMLKKLMDTVEYRYEGGKNILTITKNKE